MMEQAVVTAPTDGKADPTNGLRADTRQWYVGPRLADVAPGVPTRVEAAGRQWMLVNVDGTVYALADRCTHTGDSLSEVGEVDDTEIECASHGARFDLVTGEARCLPATKSLAVAEVRVTADGDIELGINVT